MFKKLRNKLIWINFGITTAVIITAFSAIYLSATRSANERPPMNLQKTETYSDEIENIIQISIQNEKQAAANNLLITLIVSGVIIEVIVVLISYFLAEEAIKPVREAYESQKIFIANASHEIKTPLAAISANLEAADIHGNKWINNVKTETDKLANLNNELLSLARSDLIKQSAIEEVDLTKLATDLLDGLSPRMSKIHFTKEISARGKVQLPVADFSQIFNILVDNAIKYCHQTISLKLTNHELSVSNDGTTIDSNTINHIFERFYQADKTAEGVGLGLSIAKSIADRNGWTITAKSLNDTTEFILDF